MDHINYISKDRILELTNQRLGEVKIGEKIEVVKDIRDLESMPQKYVLLGIPEDIGVFANHGQRGTRHMWDNFLSVFLNMQENNYNSAADLVVLGEIDCVAELNDVKTLDKNNKDYYLFLGNIVETIDRKVESTVSKVFEADKIPIVIGGGHNNAYGLIKGFYSTFKTALNILNIDAHTDLRKTNYRHSGNGFSFALEEGLINRYFMFGIQKPYTPQYIYDYIAERTNIEGVFLEDILHYNPIEKLGKLKYGINFLIEHFGVEIDCDSIENFNSSAMTNSGFTINEMRNFINILKKSAVRYIHFCEGVPTENKLTAKALSYFVADFIRA